MRPEPTLEEREGYLEGLRDGQPRPVAARRVNKEQTGSAFRALIRKDTVFAAQVEEAEADGHQEHQDMVRAMIQRRALNPEDRSTKPLEMAAAASLPEYAYLRRNGGGGGGDDGDTGPQGWPMGRSDLLTSAQIETLLLLYDYAQGKKPNPELQAELAARQLEAAQHPVIDA